MLSSPAPAPPHAAPPAPLLLGNSFPLALVRRKVVIEPAPAATLAGLLRVRPVASYWGHANTLHAAEALLGVPLAPATARPALGLDANGLPTLDGHVFDECWVLAPDYAPGFRPQVGEEVPAAAILGWQALRMTWAPSTESDQGEEALVNDPANGSPEWLFGFAAKGIQSYIFGTTEMREMVGATEIVDALPIRTLSETLAALGLRDRCSVLSAAAGAARVRFESRDDAERLATVWPMICAQSAPGLEVAHGLVPMKPGEYLGAVQALEAQLALARHNPTATLPETTPLVARNPRTGMAAVAVHGLDQQLIDEPARAKREVRRGSRVGTRDDGWFLPAICEKMGFEDSAQVPKTMETIAGEERSYLAVVHADGNGLGQMFINLGRHLAGRPSLALEHFYADLSRTIDRAGTEAAREALNIVRQEVSDSFPATSPWPVLPIVFAGDDLTIVLRADLALPFAESFLTAFARATAAGIQRVRSHYPFATEENGLPASLTAGAGIAYVKRRYPYNSANALAESLAGMAKRVAKTEAEGRRLKRVPATLAFHRVTASSTDEAFVNVRRTELTSPSGVVLSMAPYVVGETDGGLPKFRDLRALAESLLRLPSGQTRELLSLVQTDRGRASKHFERLVKLQDEAANEANGSVRPGRELRECLLRLTGNSAQPLWSAANQSPLGDALTHAYFIRQRRRYRQP